MLAGNLIGKKEGEEFRGNTLAFGNRCNRRHWSTLSPASNSAIVCSGKKVCFTSISCLQEVLKHVRGLAKEVKRHPDFKQ